MKSLYIPLKSFQIPEVQMRLCDSALGRVQQVKNLSDANTFLEAFGSHVPQTRYHLGGVLFQEMVVACAETVSLSELLHEAARAMKGSVTAGSSFVGSATVEGASSSSESHGTSKICASNFTQTSVRVRALGPTNVRDEDEFRSKLEEGPSSWSIINKGVDTVEDLVAVWKVILQHRQYAEDDRAKEALKRAAMLLYEAWLNKARPTRRIAPHQLIAALFECEERNYRPFQRLHGVYELEDEVISPLTEALTWVSPAVELPNELRTVLQDESSSDLSGEVSYILQSCIGHLRSTPGGENHYEQTVNVIREYGFDKNGRAEHSMRVEHLRSMIEELDNLNNRMEERSTDPQHPADLSWEHTRVCWTTQDSIQSTAEYTYIGDVLVDKPMIRQSQTLSAHARRLLLIDRLRHSIDPFQRQTVEGKTKWKRNASPANKVPGAHQDPGSCVFEDLLHLMRGSDLPAQVGICRFLLGQRAATPLVAEMATEPLEPTGTSEPSARFAHWVQALSFVEVKLPEQKRCYVAEDLALPRVVFLSDVGIQKSQAAKVASRILSCNFPSQHMNRQGLSMSTPNVQVGIGFLDSKPCVAVLVEGAYQGLLDFAIAVADVIVLEQVKDVGRNFNCEGKRVVGWNIDVADGCATDSCTIWGTEGYLVGEIGDYLRSELMDGEVQIDVKRANLKELCISHFLPKKLISFQHMQEIAETCGFTKGRESYCLQDSFAREASSFFAGLRLKNHPADRRLKDRECEREKKFRFRQSSSVVKNPLLRVFRMVLCQKTATERRVGLMWLQRFIFENNLAVGAKTDLGLVNLWRELCHLFVASPGSQRDLAKLAAQHLLDGFPLEILDGDASMFCQPWVETVLSELQSLTDSALERPAKLFVLSAMGLQSSGKSTMLNLMFGAQLVASAGRCTRGVLMQLVPSKRPEFDYVLILDTEGLRSHAFHGSELGDVRDNRLAVFGLLPADASIFMISNEDDNGLKEVLPMVLLGFKGSVIAEESCGKIRAKMFFVYRSVDTNDQEKLHDNKKKLWKHLADASKEVANMGRRAGASDDDERLLQNMFQDLLVDEDEEKSDVRCMGNLKKGSKPPEDVPDWEYGKQVMQLREHIQRRVLEGGRWNSVGIKEWGENLSRVWTCICEADFELGFKTAVECSSYAELQEELTNGPRRMVNTQFMEEFEKLERRVREFANTDQSVDHAQKPKVSDLFVALQNGVRSVVIVQTSKVVDEILGRKSWSKWKQQEESNWKMFCTKLEDSYKSRIKDMCDGLLEYDAAARRYEMQMKKEIVAKFQNKGVPEHNKKEREDYFQGLFKRILSEAEHSHPPLAREVGRKVTEAYDRTRVTEAVYLFTNNSLREKIQAAGGMIQQTMRLSGGKCRVNPEELQKKLKECIDGSLKDQRQYSEVIAESVIAETTRMISNAGCSRDHEQQSHGYVKDRLTDCFGKIQALWDKEHNIATKLRGAEVRLRAFFESCADGIGAASMLLSELGHLLEDELVERQRDVFLRFLCECLSSNVLVRDWSKLRGCLDLHLLTLISNGSHTKQLLRFVADGSAHYNAVTDVLIGVEICKSYNKQQKEYLGAVAKSLKDAANYAKDARSTEEQPTTTVEFFLETLKEIMEDRLGNYDRNSPALPLGQFLFRNVSRDAYERGSSGLDSDFYKTGVRKLCQIVMSLNDGRQTPLRWVTRNLANEVRKRMMVMGNDDFSPRCTEKCPRCGIMCINAAGHMSKHDTVHQVSGLTGNFNAKTRELWGWNCRDDIVQGNRFRYQGTWYSAKRFEKVFPGWVNPCGLSQAASRSLKVREYIFYHYQDALIDMYPASVSCRHIPSRYNHDLQMLHNLIHNTLQDDYERLTKLFARSYSLSMLYHEHNDENSV